MAPELPNTIYPCPFSKNYGIPEHQAWLLLKISFLYRFIVASLFVILFFSPSGPSLLGGHDQALYINTSLIYLGITLLSMPFTFWRLFSYVHQAQLVIFVDILFITLLMHACGGVSSGIGILLAISIAEGGLLIGGRCAMLFAALASLAMLGEEIFTQGTRNLRGSSFTYAGMLGASYFTIAFLSQVLAQRTEQSQLLASERQQTIIRLEELNRYIIQHLQSGIIICTATEQVLQSNEAILRLLKLSSPPLQISDICPQLTEALAQWRIDPGHNNTIIRLNNGQDIQIRFSLLSIQDEVLYMIIFEDIALYNQRLQQNKLASLGRLTASIAHEIRNPLGAISHAGQLLLEASELMPENKRLSRIIYSQSQRVNHIIEGVLKLSRRNQSAKSKIFLDSWLPEFIASMVAEQGYDRQRFNLVFIDHSLTALVDVGHLKQILNNLCANALKYGSQRDEQIILEVRRDADYSCISVQDHGAEIEPAIQQHLFEPFFTTSSSGTGLGLYISRELAELNQAKLNYAFVNNKSCFTLCLPNAERAVIEI